MYQYFKIIENLTNTSGFILHRGIRIQCPILAKDIIHLYLIKLGIINISRRSGQNRSPFGFGYIRQAQKMNVHRDGGCSIGQGIETSGAFIGVVLWNVKINFLMVAIGLTILQYYLFSISFRVAFVFGHTAVNTLPFLAYDFLFDAYWIADTVLKVISFQELELAQCITLLYSLELFFIFLQAYFFSEKSAAGHLVTDPYALFARYKLRGSFYRDVLASLPLEIFSLASNVTLGTAAEDTMALLFILRCVHLIRGVQILEYIDLLERMLLMRYGVHIGSARMTLLKSIFMYISANHLLACMYFMVHRYPERHDTVTWVIMDGHATYDPDTGMHDICNVALSTCYARSVYFTLSTMTSVGYADICPFTNLEFLMEQLIALVGSLCTGTANHYYYFF